MLRFWSGVRFCFGGFWEILDLLLLGVGTDILDFIFGGKRHWVDFEVW